MNTLFARSLTRGLRTATSKPWTSQARPIKIHPPRHPAPSPIIIAITPLRSLSTFSTPTPQPQYPHERTRPPSAIEKASLPLLTPGHAIRILQIHGAGGIKLIRNADFYKLCNSARSGKKRDAKVISTALRDFRRCNKFILEKLGAKLALEGMMRGMIPNYKVVYGIPKVEAAAYALGEIGEETTGLYYAVEVEVVDAILECLLEGLYEMMERGSVVRVDLEEDLTNARDENGGYEISDKKTLRAALESTVSSINQLIRRRARPEEDMKKRARRRYLKYLKTDDGPSVSTMKLATQISLVLGGPEYTREKLIEPYRSVWWTKGVVDEGVLGLVEEAEAAAERAEQEAAAAAAAAAAEAENEDGDTEEETSEDDAGEANDETK